MAQVNFDLDVLRSFVTGLELGSYAKAAERLGRSTSAVSAQLKKLEEQAGTPIFRKSGRGLALTDAGETMLGYARRLLELNDEAAVAMRGRDLEGWVRLGLQEDFAETLLPEVLGRFARAHPRLKVEARVARNAELLERVTTGKLDLALAWSLGDTTPHAKRIAEVPLCWIGGAERPVPVSRDEPLPLAALASPCLFRNAATEALDHAGISWRIAFESPSLAGLWAATSAGLGIALRTPLGLSPRVAPLTPATSGLPTLGSLDLVLHRAEAEPEPATARLAEILIDELDASIRH
ncbi:MAG TPA: LysR substrate-binding domain-containing protein [Stellaceae bacterium]|nr:LysR substrate-binding domain-containing protein [Stellaceae bacterium]